jgi:hypothetical protein
MNVYDYAPEKTAGFKQAAIFILNNLQKCYKSFHGEHNRETS